MKSLTEYLNENVSKEQIYEFTKDYGVPQMKTTGVLCINRCLKDINSTIKCLKHDKDVHLLEEAKQSLESILSKLN